MATRKARTAKPKTVMVRIRKGYGKHYKDEYSANGEQFIGTEQYTSESEPFEVTVQVYETFKTKFQLVEGVAEEPKVEDGAAEDGDS